MTRDFAQLDWDDRIEDDCRQLVRLAVREDLDRSWDLTTVCLVPETATGEVAIVLRRAGVVAGLPTTRVVLEEMAPSLSLNTCCNDGESHPAGTVLARIQGGTRDLLTCERIMLNFLGHLSGVATLTRQFVQAVAGTGARIYDTRKTTPGWRRLEKYAVRCGGGHNHRTGLYDAVLIKDNHLASADQISDPAMAVAATRETLREMLGEAAADAVVLEVEVDTLEQLDNVLPAAPHVILLDNMEPEWLRRAVARRNEVAPEVQLEASGSVTLETVAEVAATGVDRISAGSLTHSAAALDIGLDWC